MLIYADVSNHDRNRRGRALDWAAAFRSLAPVASVKLTEGDWFTDPFGIESCKGARAAGAKVIMGYHCISAGNINGQVDLFRRQLDAAGCNSAMADVEPFEEMLDNNRWPRWADVLAFGKRFAALDLRPLAWYIPRWFWADKVGDVDLDQGDLRVLSGPIVASNYIAGQPTATGPGWAAYGNRAPDIWQYTSTASVAGLSDNTDLNAFDGSLDELVALLTGDDMLTPDDIAALLAAKFSSPALNVTNRSVADWLKGGHSALAEVVKLGAKVDTATAADATRDAAVLAAVQALAAAGGVDAAPIVRAINAVRDDAHAEFAKLHAEIAALTAENEQLREALAAAARAEAAALDGKDS